MRLAITVPLFSKGGKRERKAKQGGKRKTSAEKPLLDEKARVCRGAGRSIACTNRVENRQLRRPPAMFTLTLPVFSTVRPIKKPTKTFGWEIRARIPPHP
jgi:hypothetical protein